MNTTDQIQSKPKTFKEKAEEEAVKAFQLTIYFGIWFCALAFLAATMLAERPIPLTIFFYAIIKAALCAKFLLVGQAILPIKINKNNGIVGSLIIESLIYLVIVLGLNYLEAGIHGLINGKEFFTSMTEFGESNPLRVLAMAIVYWLIVWPYLLLQGFKLVIGSKASIEILFGHKSPSPK